MKIDDQIYYWAHMLDEAFNEDITSNSLNEGATDTMKTIQRKLKTFADAITLFDVIKKYFNDFLSRYERKYGKVDNISKFNQGLYEASTKFNEIMDFLSKLIKKNDPQYKLIQKTPGAKQYFKTEMHNPFDVRGAGSAIRLFTYDIGRKLKYGENADPFTRRKIPVGADPKDDIAWWYNLHNEFSISIDKCSNFILNLMMKHQSDYEYDLY